MANVVTILINARDNTTSALRSARAAIGALAQHVRDGAGRFASAFQDSFGGGLRSALSTPYVGPIIIAAVAGMAVILAPLIATLIGSALVLGLGAAFLGVGAMLLMQNDKLKKTLSADFKSAGDTLRKAFEPLIPVLEHVGDVMKNLAKFFAPFIKAASTEIQPHLIKFIDNLQDAFKNLAPAIGPLMDAFGKLLDDIGPQLPKMFQDLATALTLLFEEVGKNPGTITGTIKVIMFSLNMVIITLMLLTKTWRYVAAAIDWVWERIKDAAGWIADAWGAAVERVSEWSTSLVANVRRMARNIRSGVSGMWNRVTDTLEGIRERVSDFVSSVVGFARRLRNNARSAVSGLWNGITSAMGSIRSRVSGFIGGIVGSARSLANRIRGAVSGMWNGITSGVRNAYNNAIGILQGLYNRAVSIINNIKSAASSIVGMIPGFASGGIVGAAGGGPRSNLVMVGEQGRELVRLPFGSQVIPNGATERAMGGGGGGGPIMVQILIGTQNLGEVLIDPIRKSVASRGGNVQVVLGRS